MSATESTGYRYDSLVAAGGVGAGIAFRLLTGETLGRNESRPAVLLPARDYCKGHVVLHAAHVGKAQIDEGDVFVFQGFQDFVGGGHGGLAGGEIRGQGKGSASTSLLLDQ